MSISWTSVSGATSYNIYWSTTSGVTKSTGTQITGATSPYTHIGLTNGTTYYYVVTAVNSYGESSESSQVSATLTASPVGTWGVGVLRHSNDGTWLSMIVKPTFNSDGTGSSTIQENNNGTIQSESETFTYTWLSNSDGSLTVTMNFTDGSTSTTRRVISDDGKVMIWDRTDESDNQRLDVAVKLDTTKTYTNADLIGDYYFGWYNRYYAIAGLSTLDGVGNRSSTYTINAAGSISTSTSSGTYSVTSDGSYTLDIGPIGYLSGDGNFGVNADVNNPAAWSLGLSMKKADKSYSTADLAGTWAYTIFGDNDGTSFRSVIGTETCDSSGSCSYSEKVQADGSTSYQSGTDTYTVASDGSVTDTYNQSEFMAIGNNGNTIITNNSFNQDNSGKRRIGIWVKCSACSNLVAVPQYTASGTYTYASGTINLIFTSSDFTCNGPLAGDTGTKTGVTITSTTMTWLEDNNMTWTRSSGTADNIVGTWTVSDSTTGNSYTLTFNADGTMSLVGNIVQCGGGAEVSVRIKSVQNDGYYLDLIADGQLITSGTVTGPNIGTLDLKWTPAGIPTEESMWSVSQNFGSTKPTPGDTYTFNLKYSDSTSETLTDSVYDITVGFATLTSPTNGSTVNTLIPTFSWGAASGAAWYHLLVWDSQGNTIWAPHIDSPTTSVVYNFDGKAAQSLKAGETYNWGLNSFDDGANNPNGGHDNFTGVNGGTFTVATTAAKAH